MNPLYQLFGYNSLGCLGQSYHQQQSQFYMRQGQQNAYACADMQRRMYEQMRNSMDPRDSSRMKTYTEEELKEIQRKQREENAMKFLNDDSIK